MPRPRRLRERRRTHGRPAQQGPTSSAKNGCVQNSLWRRVGNGVRKTHINLLGVGMRGLDVSGSTASGARRDAVRQRPTHPSLRGARTPPVGRCAGPMRSTPAHDETTTPVNTRAHTREGVTGGNGPGGPAGPRRPPVARTPPIGPPPLPDMQPGRTAVGIAPGAGRGRPLRFGLLAASEQCGPRGRCRRSTRQPRHPRLRGPASPAPTFRRTDLRRSPCPLENSRP